MTMLRTAARSKYEPVDAAWLTRHKTQKDDACLHPEAPKHTRSLIGTLALTLPPALCICLSVALFDAASITPSQGVAWEQVSGGILLATYIYSLFKNEELVRVTALAGQGESLKCEPLWRRGVVAMAGFALGVIILNLMENDGTVPWPVGNTTNTILSGKSDMPTKDSDLAPFIIGFITDGIVIAMLTSADRGQTPTLFDLSRENGGWPVTQELILACLLSLDNVVTGFGLASYTSTTSQGREYWAGIFFLCVLAGGGVGYGLRKFCKALATYFVKDDVNDSNDTNPAYLLELFVKVMFMTSILDASLELLTHGLTFAATVGFIIAWVLQFLGDKLVAVKYALAIPGTSVEIAL